MLVLTLVDGVYTTVSAAMRTYMQIVGFENMDLARSRRIRTQIYLGTKNQKLKIRY